MSHPDQETLVGLALGDEASSALDAHVEQCQECRGEVERTRTVLAAVPQLGGGPVELEQPPTHVWDDICESVSAAAPQSPARLPHVCHGARRRPVAAVAAGLLAGVAATLAVVSATNDEVPGPAPTPTDGAITLTQGQMVPFSADSATAGTAKVVSRDGQRQLQVQLSDLPGQRDAYVQTWLLDPATNEMIALGLMDGGSASFAIPVGVDLAAFTAVDVSLEPFDGNPAHSDTSLARGVLEG